MTERLDSELPIFRLSRGSSSVFYAPGYLAAGMSPELRRCAAEARERWRRLTAGPFAPECLTLYLNDRCNLACSYCFATSRPVNSARIDEQAALAAARLVARCCAGSQKPFHLALHGGGEPTLEWGAVVRLTAGTRAAAGGAGVGWFGYLATNGALSEERVAWLAREFDALTLSCDGPPDIQDRQRPLAGGGPSSPLVERTARVLRRAGKAFTVRSTITPATVERQAEIAAYNRNVLGAVEMRFEPLYVPRGTGAPAFRPDDAARFVRRFLAAQRETAAHGGNLSFSGCRLDETHGPYCNVLRNSLHLLPDGSATACFACVGEHGATGEAHAIGRRNRESGEYVLDHSRLTEMRRRAAAIPQRCRDCVNIYHCARECPEGCQLEDSRKAEAPGFRCLVQRLLAEEWIFEAAGLGA